MLDYVRVINFRIIIIIIIKVASGRRIPVVLTFVQHILCLLLIGRLPLLTPDCEAVSRTMSPLPHHCQHFVENSKLTYFIYRTRTLFLDFLLPFTV